jgi:hypothetical protein
MPLLVTAAQDIAREFIKKLGPLPLDFDVGVQIIEARNICAPGDEFTRALPSPFIVVTVHGEELKSSRKVKDTSTHVFNKMMVFEVQKSALEFFQGVIKIEVFDRRLLLSDVPIGSVHIGIADIYMSDNHRIPPQWFAIRNTQSEDFKEERGYLKLRLHVLGPEDKAVLEEPPLFDEYRKAELLRSPR